LTNAWSRDEIRAYWTKQASEHGASPSASWSDVRVMELEIREITARLPEAGRVLDVGCANGWSTLQFAAERTISIRGVDYIPEMIEVARARLAETAVHLRGTVDFAVGDALDLDETTEAYDTVVSIRVMINLGDWENQLRGLQECTRVLRSGGTFLLSEATIQGWSRLNALRREWGLEDISMPTFNNYLDEERVVEEMTDRLELVDIVNFASSYYVGTRLLKPLLAAGNAAHPSVADPNSEWNRWCASLTPFGDYGTQKLFVFRKR
jgi:ubiquinone/menaquinone biosynthesis C-methylase UbiE